MILYKYLSIDRIHVIENLKFRFSQPGALNDPFEMKPYITQLADETSAREQFYDMFSGEKNLLSDTYKMMPEEFQASVSFHSFKSIVARNENFLLEKVTDGLSRGGEDVSSAIDTKFNELLGIFSLTEKPDNLLMWSHYANAYEGFVIGFDSNNQFFDRRRSSKDEFYHLRKVEYRDLRPNTPLSGLNGVDVFLVKSTDWKYEQEWRFMCPLRDAVERRDADPFPVFLFDIPYDAVTTVVLGSRMAARNKEAIKGVITRKPELAHVEILYAVPHDREFKLRLLAELS